MSVMENYLNKYIMIRKRKNQASESDIAFRSILNESLICPYCKYDVLYSYDRQEVREKEKWDNVINDNTIICPKCKRKFIFTEYGFYLIEKIKPKPIK